MNLYFHPGMPKSATLQDLLDDHPVLVLDGAMGTEIDRRGGDVSLPLWSSRALETAPQMVRSIHQDYVSAGARIITANTFRTTTYTYQRAGFAEAAARLKAARATGTAVQLALEAAHGRALVAGSLAPLGDCYTPEDYPGPDNARHNYTEQANRLAQAGVDLFLLETHITLEEALAALMAATATGLPVWVSFLVDDRCQLPGGHSLQDAVQAVENGGAAAILVNCVTLPVAAKAAEFLPKATRLPAGIYANAGHSQPSPAGALTATYSDNEYLAAAISWVNYGIRIIGGCCGTTPLTTRRLADHFHPLDPSH
ncbi:Homocysteine S-methyltransferase [subsurface metagenome]